MELRLLGSVEVWAGGHRLDVGPPQRRATLAALLVDAGRLVPTETLIDRVWADEPPQAAREALYANISRLRRLFRQPTDGPDQAQPVVLLQRGGGYTLQVAPERVDLLRFRDLVRAARQREPAGRAVLLRQALDLWRGPALADVPGNWATRMRRSWSLERLDAAVEWARAELRLGRQKQLVGGLRTLVAEYPLAEPLTAVLMRALADTGRVAEALDCYATIRTELVEQLGAEPGRELRELHEGLLRDGTSVGTDGTAGTDRTDGTAEPAGTDGAAKPAETPETARVPAGRNDLSGDIVDFTGREAELRQLLDFLPAEVGAGPAVVLSAIDGMAGIGKTALAVHAAHRLTSRYPDAQLMVDLHGHATGREPARPHAVLESLLGALGVPGSQIPDGLDERASLWRAELAGRRALVVLDNAANAAQVRPLLPGTSRSLTLITSRRRLTELDGAHVISLDVLPPDDALTLFHRVLGTGRAPDPADDVAEVVRLCGYLPLAIRIAAARLRTRPAWTVAHLADRLASRQRRLTELTVGDRSVAAAFALSYQHLGEEQRRTFRFLGLVPGPDFDDFATAAVLGTDLERAGRLLEELVDVHLLQQPAPGRYRFHDLLRVQAEELVRQTDPEPETRAATERLFDYYLHTTGRAAAGWDARGTAFQLTPAYPPTAAPELENREQVAAWLDGEYANLLAAVTHAAQHGPYAPAWQLPHLLISFFHARGRLGDWLSTHQLGLQAARRAADRHAEAETLKNLGVAYWVTMRMDEALAHNQEALALFQQAGNQRGEGDALNNLGLAHERLGRYDEAIDYYERALVLRLAIGDWRGEGGTLQNLANVYDKVGRLTDARDRYRRSLEIFQRHGDLRAEAIVLGNLGILLERQEQYDDAIEVYQRSLALADEIDDQWVRGNNLTNLGSLHRKQGRYDEAIETHAAALALLREIGDRGAETEVLNNLADAHLDAGQHDRAGERYRQALALAGDVGHRHQEGNAHRGLGRLLRDGDPGAARRHWEQALEIYAELGVPEAAELSALLAHLPAEPD
ncbi:AfsR/SARP family transcriptional regulator [Plantactinospora endophytica]|uniref:SARP family transcriptional regulator n=1 Tax=Plantactinospora endophytica TaxID=673535 RepID=A0ABQ4E6H9_9ACTN|nr:tetratricopeptide repeat protein [Plantactinospora endophytica]GIG90288.1 SARP family transcriptional regulator [Plantactinospora endophytica]